MNDVIRMDIQGDVATAGEEDTTAVEETATAVEVEMTKATLDEATAATARYSRLAEPTRTRRMIPHLTEPWFHTMGANRRMSSFALRRGVEDRLEEASAEVRTDEEAEEEADFRKETVETGISPGTRRT